MIFDKIAFLPLYQNDSVSRNLQIFILQATMQKYLENFEAQEIVDIDINHNTFIYEIKYFQQFDIVKFSKKLNQIQIVVFDTNYQQEAIAYNKLLQQGLNKQLQIYLNCEFACTTVIHEILNKVNQTNASENQINQNNNDFISREKQLFLIFQNNQNESIINMRQKLTKFFEDNIVKINHVLIQNPQEFEQIKQNIKKIESQRDILIDVQSLSNYFQVKFTIWIEKKKIDLKNEIVKSIEGQLFSHDSRQKLNQIVSFSKKVSSSIINSCFIEINLQEQSNFYFLWLEKQFNGSNYFIMEQKENNLLKKCKIYFKGINQTELRKEAIQILSNFQVENFEIQSKLLAQWPNDEIFKNQFNFMLDFMIKKPACVVIYNPLSNILLNFLINFSNNILDIKNQLLSFINSLVVQPLTITNENLFQIFNVMNCQDFCQQEYVIVGENFIIGQIDHLNRIKNKINTQNSIILNHCNPLHQLAILQSDIYSSVSDQFQNLSKKYCNQTINLSEKMIKELEKNSVLKQLEYHHSVQMVKKIKNITSKFSLSFQSLNEKKFLVSDQQLSEVDCQLIININKNIECMTNFEGINDQCFQLIKSLSKNSPEIINQQIQNLQSNQYQLHKLNENKFLLTLINENFFDKGVCYNEKCFQDIEKNLQLIFQIANDNKFDSIGLPMFGCGPCDIGFKQIASKLFIQIIKNFKQSEHVQKVIIVEAFKKRLKQFTQLVNQELVLTIKRFPTFKWGLNKQLFEQDIIDQIETAFDKFKEDNNQDKAFLEYSFFKPPATHEFDLIKMQLRKINSNFCQQLEKKAKNTSIQFLIDQNPVTERLNDFLNLCILYHMHKVNVNLDESFIIFQENQTLLFDKAEAIVVHKYLASVEPKKDKILTDFKIDSPENEENQQIQIKECDESQKEKILNEIENYVEQNCQTFEINLKTLTKGQRQVIVNELSNLSLKVIENQNSNIMLKCHKKFSKEIQNQLQNLAQIGLPSDWLPMEKNFEIDELPQHHKLYDLVNKQYNDLIQNKQNYENKIKILKIKNQDLWEQYTIDTLQSKKRHEAENINLSDLEKESMMWVILESHPKYSYRQSSNGIQTHKCGPLGEGAYFTHALQESNLYKESNKIRLALFCKVWIGKTKQIQSKQQFYNESQNYDSFLFEGEKSSKVFLKGKIITRAYPMYEIQFYKD